MQLWLQGGITVSVRGTEDKMEVAFGTEEYRKPTETERKNIRVEELAQMYASRDIFCCDSALVSDAMRASYDAPSEFLEEFSTDNMKNYTADPSNWDMEQCHDWLEDKGIDCPSPNPWDMTREELIELHQEEVGSETSDAFPPDDELRTLIIKAMDEEDISGLDDWRDMVRDNTGEHEAEVYEWYRVSNWLGKNLEEIGEVVLDNSYGKWWGRQCTGQSYMMDCVLQRIALQFA